MADYMADPITSHPGHPLFVSINSLPGHHSRPVGLLAWLKHWPKKNPLGSETPPVVGGNGETPSSCFMFISIEPSNSWTSEFQLVELVNGWFKPRSFAGGKDVYDSKWRFLKMQVPPNHPNFDNFNVETIWNHVFFFGFPFFLQKPPTDLLTLW